MRNKQQFWLIKPGNKDVMWVRAVFYVALHTFCQPFISSACRSNFSLISHIFAFWSCPVILIIFWMDFSSFFFFFFFLIIIFWWVLVLIKVRAEGPRNEIYLSDLPSIKNQDSTSPPLLIVIIKNNKIKHIMDVLRNWVNNILKMKIDWRTKITIL